MLPAQVRQCVRCSGGCVLGSSSGLSVVTKPPVCFRALQRIPTTEEEECEPAAGAPAGRRAAAWD